MVRRPVNDTARGEIEAQQLIKLICSLFGLPNDTFAMSLIIEQRHLRLNGSD